MLQAIQTVTTLVKVLLLVVTISFAAEGASDKAGFDASLRAFYFSSDRDDRQDREALAIGGIFKYTTPSLIGLSGSAAFYTSYDLLRRGRGDVVRIKNGTVVSDTSDIGGNSELVQSDGSAIESLGEAYVQYKISRTKLRIGRQRLDTPLLNDYSNRFLPNSFEAAVMTNEDLEDTMVTLAVVDRWRYKTEEDFKGIAEGVGLEKNLYIAGIRNSGMENIEFQGWFYRLSDAFDSFYASAEHGRLVTFAKEWKLGGAMHYLKQNDCGSAQLGSLDTHLAGAKLMAGGGAWRLAAMVDQVGDDTIRGSGTDYVDLGWSQFVNYTDIQIDGEALNAGALSYGGSAEYCFTSHYKAGFKYVHIDQDNTKQLASTTPNRRPDSDEWNIDMTYKSDIHGQLRVRLGQIDYAYDPVITNEYDEVNLRVIYDFGFRVN